MQIKSNYKINQMDFGGFNASRKEAERPQKKSGVQNSKKNQTRLNSLLSETTVQKSSVYKKPICSLDVLLRMVLSDSKKKTAMNVWSEIRRIFPYYSSGSSLALRPVVQALRTSDDVEAILDSQESNIVNRRKYVLKSDIEYTHDLQEIIGEDQNLEDFTMYPEYVLKRLSKSLEKRADHSIQSSIQPTAYAEETHSTFLFENESVIVPSSSDNSLSNCITISIPDFNANLETLSKDQLNNNQLPSYQPPLPSALPSEYPIRTDLEAPSDKQLNCTLQSSLQTEKTAQTQLPVIDLPRNSPSKIPSLSDKSPNRRKRNKYRPEFNDNRETLNEDQPSQQDLRVSLLASLLSSDYPLRTNLKANKDNQGKNYNQPPSTSISLSTENLVRNKCSDIYDSRSNCHIDLETQNRDYTKDVVTINPCLSDELPNRRKRVKSFPNIKANLETRNDQSQNSQLPSYQHRFPFLLPKNPARTNSEAHNNNQRYAQPPIYRSSIPSGTPDRSNLEARKANQQNFTQPSSYRSSLRPDYTVRPDIAHSRSNSYIDLETQSRDQTNKSKKCSSKNTKHLDSLQHMVDEFGNMGNQQSQSNIVTQPTQMPCATTLNYGLPFVVYNNQPVTNFTPAYPNLSLNSPPILVPNNSNTLVSTHSGVPPNIVPWQHFTSVSHPSSHQTVISTGQQNFTTIPNQLPQTIKSNKKSIVRDNDKNHSSAPKKRKTNSSSKVKESKEIQKSKKKVEKVKPIDHNMELGQVPGPINPEMGDEQYKDYIGDIRVSPMTENDFDPLNLNPSAMDSEHDVFTVAEPFSIENSNVDTSVVNTYEERIPSNSPDIILVKQISPSPDSTILDIISDKSYGIMSNERKLFKSEPVDVEDEVSSTSAQVCAPFEDRNFVSGDSKESELQRADSQKENELIGLIKTKFDWFTIDTTTHMPLCKLCQVKFQNNLLEMPDIYAILMEHEVSEYHESAPIRKNTKLELMYFLFKRSIKHIEYKNQFVNSLSDISTNLSQQKLNEKNVYNLLSLWKQYTEYKILIYIQRSKQPYTLALSFCNSLGMLRTCSESGNLFECVLAYDNLEDRTVIGFLNKFNLSASQLMHFSVLPDCKNCDECKNSTSILEENSILNLPFRFPELKDLVHFLLSNSQLKVYSDFANGMISLYKSHPTSFKSIKCAYLLQNCKNIWELSAFIEKNIKELINVCRKIFGKCGVIESLSYMHLGLEISSKFLETLKQINSVFRFVKMNSIKFGSDSESKSKSQINEKVNRLKRDIYSSNIEDGVKGKLVDYVEEICKDVYYSHWSNSMCLQKFCDPEFIEELGDSGIENEEIRNVFSVMGKYMDAPFETVSKELKEFVNYAAGLADLNFRSLSRFTKIFKSHPFLKNRYPLSFKFYNLMKLIPIYNGSRTSHSFYFVNTNYQNLKKTIGKVAAKAVIMIWFDAFPAEKLGYVTQFLDGKLKETHDR